MTTQATNATAIRIILEKIDLLAKYVEGYFALRSKFYALCEKSATPKKICNSSTAPAYDRKNLVRSGH